MLDHVSPPIKSRRPQISTPTSYLYVMQHCWSPSLLYLVEFISTLIPFPLNPLTSEINQAADNFSKLDHFPAFLEGNHLVSGRGSSNQLIAGNLWLNVSAQDIYYTTLPLLMGFHSFIYVTFFFARLPNTAEVKHPDEKDLNFCYLSALRVTQRQPELSQLKEAYHTTHWLFGMMALVSTLCSTK